MHNNNHRGRTKLLSPDAVPLFKTALDIHILKYFLPSIARMSVISSAYSISPPTGIPYARRETSVPRGSRTLARYAAVASPEGVGLVATITSFTPSDSTL